MAKAHCVTIVVCFASLALVLQCTRKEDKCDEPRLTKSFSEPTLRGDPFVAEDKVKPMMKSSLSKPFSAPKLRGDPSIAEDEVKPMKRPPLTRSLSSPVPRRNRSFAEGKAMPMQRQRSELCLDPSEQENHAYVLSCVMKFTGDMGMRMTQAESGTFLTKYSRDQKTTCEPRDYKSVSLLQWQLIHTRKWRDTREYEKFYHGTREESVHRIAEKGFAAPPPSNSNDPDAGLMVGAGFYVAKVVNKADQYAVPTKRDPRLLTILQMRVHKSLVKNAVRVFMWKPSKKKNPNDLDEYISYIEGEKVVHKHKSALLETLRNKYADRMIHLLSHAQNEKKVRVRGYEETNPEKHGVSQARVSSQNIRRIRYSQWFASTKSPSVSCGGLLLQQMPRHRSDGMC
eukprot:TRINITY_DN33913_c0_g1_i1.p1 TRINITY_DN33913_c0_g1~~TRINITY_DN33913_c0_g1_i1.p1  ORF type:complete len:398 (+),score=25.08 TRINITY_DN33913_c0_g1_i1:24-1217(+)